MASMSPRHGGTEGGIANLSPSYPTRQAPVQNLKQEEEAFGSGSNIKIPIDPSTIGLIIGKKGRNAKRICRETGLVYFTVAYTALDSNNRSRRQDVLIMEGSLQSIAAAIHIVRRMFYPDDKQDVSEQFRHKKYKTKLCFRFSRGLCPYGKACQFAHGEEELLGD